MMFILSPIFMRWSAPSSFKTRWSHSQSWWVHPSNIHNYAITSFKSHSHVGDDNMTLSFKYNIVPQSILVVCIFSYSFECNCMPTSVDSHVSKDFLQVYLCFPDCWRGSLDHGLSLNNIAPNMIWMCSFIDYLSLNTIVFSTLIHHLIIFHCPQLIWILFVFLPMIHCVASRWSTFQGVSRNVDVILVKDFANSVDVLVV